jgi:hypothetical protein
MPMVGIPPVIGSHFMVDQKGSRGTWGMTIEEYWRAMIFER